MPRGMNPNSLRARRHNALFGSLRSAELLMQDIMRIDSTSYQAKEEADAIYDGIQRLREHLKTRIDP